MKANNLTISIPTYGKCNKNCPYCISRMTGFVQSNIPKVLRNIPKAKRLAKAAQVSSVLITSKGEPLMNMAYVSRICREFSEFPLELQTNGLLLAKDLKMIELLEIDGLDTIAVSVDYATSFDEMVCVFKKIEELGMTCRMSLNITKRIGTVFGTKDCDLSFEMVMNFCKHWGVHQLLLRNIVSPSGLQHTDEGKWIAENHAQPIYSRLWDEMMEKNDSFNMELPFGSSIFEIDGVSVSCSDYCIQEKNRGDDIRSLIFLEDGHCYPSWNTKGSRFF